MDLSGRACATAPQTEDPPLGPYLTRAPAQVRQDPLMEASYGVGR